MNIKSVKYITGLLALAMSLMVQPTLAAISANHYLKPFILGQNVSGISLDRLAQKVRGKLTSQGFQIVGTYEPYKGAKILVVTNKELKKIAAKTPLGGFAAVLKVSFADTGKGIQVSYNNPAYLGLAYNLNNKLENISRKLKAAVGYIKPFGGGKGIKESDLPTYNYSFGLEGFTGYMELGQFKTFEEATHSIETGLARGKYGITEVFRVDLPGKDIALFGLSLKADVNEHPFLNDEYVMNIIDYRPLKRLPHLPYEILVRGGEVLALHPHFRLAINFPDLHMFGANSFGKLMDLPYEYEEYFIKAIGATWPPPGQDW